MTAQKKADVSNGVKLSSKQKEALVALASAPSIVAAAKQVGVAAKTVHVWLSDEAFKTELTRVQDDILNSSIRTLKASSERAVTVLLELLSSPEDRIRLKAACEIIDRAQKFVEIEEFGRRIEALEEAVSK